MPAKTKPAASRKDSTATIDFEANLWLTAGKLRNNMDAAEPTGASQTASGSPKGQRRGAKQYKAENVLWVPAEARWSRLQASSRQPTIGNTVGDAITLPIPPLTLLSAVETDLIGKTFTRLSSPL